MQQCQWKTELRPSESSEPRVCTHNHDLTRTWILKPLGLQFLFVAFQRFPHLEHPW